MECRSGLDALEERKLLCPAGDQTILACIEDEALRNIFSCSEGGSKWQFRILQDRIYGLYRSTNNSRL
jgi:hypothetical protein